MTDKTRLVADGKIAGVGALAPLFGATRSVKGIWIVAGGPSYHGPRNILFTADGRTFRRIKPPESSFNPRCIHAIDDDRILFGGQGQLDLTTDGGKHWRPVKIEGSGWWTIAEHDGRLWAAGNGHVARSDDQGKTWKSIKIRGGGECYGLVVVSRDEAFIADEGKIHHVRGDKISVAHTCKGVYVYKLARAGDGTLVAAAAKGNVLVSRDGGKRWAKAKVPGGRDYVSVIWHADRFLIGGSKGTLLELAPDGKAKQIALPAPSFAAATDEVLGFAPMGDGVLVLGGREMDQSMTRRGVMIALGELSATSTEPAPRFTPPPLLARKQRPGVRGNLDAFETLSWKDAKARFKKLPALETPPKQVRVYPSLRVAELHLEAEPGESQLVIFDGDVYVDGPMTVVSCEDDDSYLAVHVAGNLSVQSIALSLDPRLKIDGDLEVADLVACGAGRSYIDVTGSLSCRVAIAARPAHLMVKKAFTGLAIGDENAFEGVKQIASEELAFQMLHRSVVDADSSAMDADKVRHALRKGKRVTLGL